MSDRRLPIGPACSFCLLVILVPHAARADGKFFGQAIVDVEPGIDAQRAVVAWRNGVETMIVQSDVQAGGEELGWLLPLPAEPTDVQACELSAMAALPGLVGPQIRDVSPFPMLLTAAAMLLLVTALCLYRLRPAEDHEQLGHIGHYGLVFVSAVLLLLLVSTLLPSLSLPRGFGTSPGVDVLQTKKTGVYDTAVLRAKGVDELKQWFQGNGFQYSPETLPVLAEYIEDGWCFLASKVRAEAKDADLAAVSHHPLEVSFPVDRPIYPMKLTGVGAKGLRLDLYVIGDKQARVPHLRTWRSSDYRESEPSPDLPFDHYLTEPRKTFARRDMPWHISIPDITSMMWDGCVLTRLHGRLDSSEMQEDLRIAWTDYQPTTAVVSSRTGFMTLCALVFMLVLSAGMLIAIAPFHGKEEARRRWWRRGVPWAGAVALVAAGALSIWIDTVPVKRTDPRGFVKAAIRLSAHKSALATLAEQPPLEPFPSAYAKLLDELKSKPNIAFDDDPTSAGSYHIDQKDDGWRLTIVSGRREPVTILISAEGRPLPAAPES